LCPSWKPSYWITDERKRERGHVYCSLQPPLHLNKRRKVFFPILARAMEKEGGKKRRGKREQKEGWGIESATQINNFAQLI